MVTSGGGWVAWRGILSCVYVLDGRSGIGVVLARFYGCLMLSSRTCGTV